MGGALASTPRREGLGGPQRPQPALVPRSPPGASALCPLGPVIRRLATVPPQALHVVGLAIGKRSIFGPRGVAKEQSARPRGRRILGLSPAAPVAARRAGRGCRLRRRLPLSCCCSGGVEEGGRIDPTTLPPPSSEGVLGSGMSRERDLLKTLNTNLKDNHGAKAKTLSPIRYFEMP